MKYDTAILGIALALCLYMSLAIIIYSVKRATFALVVELVAYSIFMIGIIWYWLGGLEMNQLLLFGSVGLVWGMVCRKQVEKSLASMGLSRLQLLQFWKS